MEQARIHRPHVLSIDEQDLVSGLEAATRGRERGRHITNEEPSVRSLPEHGANRSLLRYTRKKEEQGTESGPYNRIEPLPNPNVPHLDSNPALRMLPGLPERHLSASKDTPVSANGFGRERFALLAQW